MWILIINMNINYILWDEVDNVFCALNSFMLVYIL